MAAVIVPSWVVGDTVSQASLYKPLSCDEARGGVPFYRWVDWGLECSAVGPYHPRSRSWPGADATFCGSTCGGLSFSFSSQKGEVWPKRLLDAASHEGSSLYLSALAGALFHHL